jgi:hypothetical protein
LTKAKTDADLRNEAKTLAGGKDREPALNLPPARPPMARSDIWGDTRGAQRRAKGGS